MNYDTPGESTLPALAAERTLRTIGYYTVRVLPVFGLTVVVAGLLVYGQREAANLLRAVTVSVTSPGFWQAAAVGLVAQIVDGALGMAYGLTSTSFLLSVGVSPAAASVHLAEVFTTGLSGFSHWKLGNVNLGLFKRLVIPGVLGGVTGSYLLT